MNLYFRFIWLFITRAIVKDPIDMFAPCRTRFHVNLLDLDMNMHMNNGRYLSLMDLGRLDLMLRSKVLWKFVKQGYFPVVSSESIRFKKSLDPFQQFDMITHIEAWDEKDFYIRQKFVRDGQVYAEGFIKGRFLQRGRKGSVPTREVFEVAGQEFGDGKSTALADLQMQIEKALVTEKEYEIKGKR
jgi:acyl-CoA thioesterase FadM